MRRLLPIFLTLFACLGGFAAPNPPQCVFQRYSTFEGLTHDHVSDIYTDSRGFVWVCTWYGVSRFDGYTFKNFNTSPGDYSPLAHHRFLSVSEDACGHLWFTTYNHHVYRLNRYTEQFEDVVAAIPEADAKHGRVHFTVHDAQGGTYLALDDVGVVRLVGSGDERPVRVDAVYGREMLGGDASTAYVDAQDNAWIATAQGTLNYIPAEDRSRARTVSRLASPVFAFAESGRWVWGAASNCVVRASKADGYAVEVPGEGAEITAIAADSVTRTVYAGTRTGELYRLSEERMRRLTPRGARPGRIRALAADSHGVLWITTPEAGIMRYDPARGDCKAFRHEPYTVSYNFDTITRIAEGAGRLWVKMNKYGFGYYDREQDRLEPFCNDPKRLDCRMTNVVVRFDVQDDVLWFSTYYERGLCRAVLLNRPAETYTLDAPGENALSGDFRALMTDRRGRLWAGTRDGELVVFDASGEPVYRRTFRRGRGAAMIYALCEDRAGDIWVGTKGDGLYRLTTAGAGFDYRVRHYVHSPDEEFSLSHDDIYSIAEDDAGRIWVATYGGGINLLEERDGERFIHAGNLLAHYPLEDASRVRWLLSDGPGRMLAATVDGLLVFDPGEDPRRMRFVRARKIPGDAESLGNNDIIHMLKDSHGRVWLATYGGGLNLIAGYDAQGAPRFRCYDKTHGLSSNICLAVAEDRRGDIWVSTYNAVSRFDAAHERFFECRLYDNEYSSLFSEATAAAAANGDVLFGGGRNLYRFEPGKMELPKIDYKLRFTGFDVRNEPVAAGPRSPLAKPVSEAERIELPHNFSNFRMEFASLNFAIRHTVGYMYKLEGYDQDWNISGAANQAAYSNLPIGSYNLRVKAFVGTVEAADEGISMPIEVLPPPWLTWWAKALYAILAVMLIFAVFSTVDSVARLRREASVEQDMADLKLRFFTNISHELRTPLTLILGGIEDVRKHDNLSPRGDISLTLAQRNAKRMLSLINQLLDFRKIIKEKMELKISRVDLVPVVEDALEDFRELAAERKIDLLFTVSRRSILVWVDIERMESVVYNLLSNALKFTPSGGRIEVILTQRDEEEWVSLSVRDTGIGIPRDKIDTIFERFAQASRAVDPSMKGSGIGLSLCREIVALHHGEISVESRQGEGSLFTVKLRLGNSHFGMEQIDFTGAAGHDAKGDYLVSDFTPEASQRRSDVRPPEDAPRILLVEDNRELRIFMYNSLIDAYHVLEADDGVEALEKIRTDMPDIIVTDLMMPRMDGIELVAKVRGDFTMSHIPIVMLTARHSPDDRVKAMEYGADGYITKPFSIELLLARIDNLLRQRRKLFEKFSSQSARNKAVELVVEDVVVTDRDEAFMKQVFAWLGDNVENSDLTIDQLASHLGLGRTTMYNKLKSLTGKSPVELIKEYRITKSKLLLRTGQFSVSEVAYKVGFSDPGYFSRCFRERYRMSPAEYLRTHNLKNNQESKHS